MIAKSDELQTIIQTHSPGNKTFKELDIITICDIIGASML
jgi:hypothetical protein